MSIVIAAAVAADSPAIAPLLTQLGYPSSPAELTTRIEQLAGWPGAQLLLAWRGEQLCGVMQLALVPALAEPAYLEVRALVVAEGWRGQGIGTRLLAEAKRRARPHGRLRVRTNCQRQRAQHFYRQQGGVKLKRQTLFEWRGEALEAAR